MDAKYSLLRQIKRQRHVENATTFDDKEGSVESGGDALQPELPAACRDSNRFLTNQSISQSVSKCDIAAWV